MNNLSKTSNESELAYIYRVGAMKDAGILDMTWSELADIMNDQLRDPEDKWTESVYRKKYRLIKDAYEQIFADY